VPELPEVEITARRLAAGLAGARVESVLAPGLVALKTFDPPLEALVGATSTAYGGSGRCSRSRRATSRC
jgi:formamidopyrimidine-DNA glycosylase